MATTIASIELESLGGTSQTTIEEIESESDNGTPETPSSEVPSRPRKRARKKCTNSVWDHCRIPLLEVEPYSRMQGGQTRRVWYCKYPRLAHCRSYNVVSTAAAANHLKSTHGIETDTTPSRVTVARDKDLQSLFGKQHIENKAKEEAAIREALRTAADKVTIHQALLRLIIHHDLPFSAVEWPELHTFVYSLNYMAEGCIWQSHQTTANHLEKTFQERQQQVALILRQSQSLVHLTTDTWHSPNFKELQAITAHFLDAGGRRQKALLSLPELRNGHAGIEVASRIIEALKTYGISDKIGYITADNHGANDVMCREVERLLEGSHWQAKQRRLRCSGHIINIAIQAFFFAKNDEALDVVVAESERSNTSIDDELLSLSQKDEGGGWLKVQPLQKILIIITAIRRSDRLYQAFKDLAKKTIRAPNDTRWNSYLNAFEDAVELKEQLTFFCLTNQRNEEILTEPEWDIVKQTIAFLKPFKEATKRLEGDSITLDKLQLVMDSLVDHFTKQMASQRSNTSFNESIVTAWHAFDKYYRLIDETGAYTAAILLHPNYRKSYLEAAWKRQWVSPGVERARQLWQQYKGDSDTLTTEDDLSHLTQYERFQYETQQKQRRGKSGLQDEFERFIIAPPDLIKGHPLDWWLQTSQRDSYPALSQMAIDVLSAMAMSAESERVFSAARRTIPWTRARLESKAIEHSECVKHWQKASLISPTFALISDGDSEVQKHLQSAQNGDNIEPFQST